MLAIVSHAAFLVLAGGVALKVGMVLWRQGDATQVGPSGPGWPKDRMRTLTGLTVLGYGLVVVGAAVILLMFGDMPETPLDALLFVGTRLGVFLVVLGVTHFKCLTVLSRAARIASKETSEPTRPRRAREDPLDRVFEAIRLDAPSGL